MQILECVREIETLCRFDPDQLRDEDGQWASGGGSVGPHALQKSGKGSYTVKDPSSGKTANITHLGEEHWNVSSDVNGKTETRMAWNLKAAHSFAKEMLTKVPTREEKAPPFKGLDPEKLKAAFASNMFGHSSAEDITPGNLIRFDTAFAREVDCDPEKRILRGAVFCTRGLAADGFIVLPEGLDLNQWQKDSTITDRHIRQRRTDAGKPAVIAAARSLTPSVNELLGEVHFADTKLAREYAHLYGCNPERQAYMRGWSVEGTILERSEISWDAARALAGNYWDATLAESLRRDIRSVKVAARFEVDNVAAAAKGADRNALTRALRDGVELAGDFLVEMDFTAATEKIAELKREMENDHARIEKVEREILALRRDGYAAAARGDTAAALQQLDEMLRVVRVKSVK
jgi:hypothetical protein